jgi:hypothetical protein
MVGIVLVSCWMLLDLQREVQQARAFARMTRDYGGDRPADGSRLQEADEYTWPIVAQQPPVFYENAITIPMPRCVWDVELPQQRPERAELADFQWPVVDVDAAGLGGVNARR